MCRTDDNVHLPFDFVRIFVDVQRTFMTADELLQNSKIRTNHGQPLPFGRSVAPVEFIFFSSRSTLF